MSKISQKNKELKAAGKKPESKKADKKAPKQKPAIESIKNFGKCCTCSFYPGKVDGVIQPCKKTGKFTARKCESCPVNAYKCKHA